MRLDTAVAKSCTLALSLFYGIGIKTQPDVATAEAMIANQYVAGEDPAGGREGNGASREAKSSRKQLVGGVAWSNGHPTYRSGDDSRS